MKTLTFNGNCTCLVRASLLGVWDLVVGNRTFHLSAEQEEWLLDKMLGDGETISLPELKQLNYTGPTIKDTSPYEFTLRFLQEHQVFYNGNYIPGDKVFVEQTGFTDLYWHGRHVSKRERLARFLFYFSIAGICGVLLPYLMGNYIDLKILFLLIPLAIWCFTKCHKSITPIFEASPILPILAGIVVLIGCFNVGGGTDFSLSDGIGTLCYVGAVFICGGGGIVCFFMALGEMQSLIN